jgi:hypothetical protein
MAVVLPISTWIIEAKIWQYLSSNENARQRIFDGQSIAPDYTAVLRMVRKSVEWAYGQNPNDDTLNVTGLYMRSLIDETKAALVVANNGCIAPSITLNPISQTISSGNNVTFIVASIGTNLSYQWKKNGVDIGGATSASYTITGATTGDAGDYSCVVSNSCGTATSTSATLTVNAAAITGSYYFGDTDYFTALNGGTDNVPYNGTFTITNGNPLSVPFPVGASNNKFNVVKYPTTQSVKASWYNTALNNGTIPDGVYRSIITIGSYYYIISRNAMSLDYTVPMIYT